tara:strand:- start:1390 stop:3477 length:2088 start_codon:yes stop_codon:yes gene_type:complete
MNLGILKKYIKEALGREIMYAPKRFVSDDLLQRELTKVKQVLKLPKNVGLGNSEEDRIKYIEFVVKDLARNVGPNTFIRFEEQWDTDIIPPLAVSPIVKWETPHGIYGYPLEEKNLERLILKSKPTNAAFATQFGFFHVYKIDSPKTVTTFLQNFEDKAINTKYNSKQNVVKDIEECVRLTSTLFRENNKNIMIADEKVIKDFEEVASSSNTSLNVFLTNVFSFKDFYINLEKTSQPIISEYKSEIAEIIFDIYTKRNPIKTSSKLSIEFYYLRLVKFVIEQIASIIAEKNKTKRGQYYSLLLKAVGIDAIIDKGTETIHVNEPIQSVSTDFSGRSIKVIGTYKNIFSNLSKGEKESLYAFLLDFISNPNKNIKWDWNQKEPQSTKNIHFESLTLKDYKYLRKKLLGHAEFSDFFSAIISYSYDNLNILKHEISRPDSFFINEDEIIVECAIDAVAEMPDPPAEALVSIVNLVDNKKYALDLFCLDKNMPRKYVKAKFDEVIKNQNTESQTAMLLENPKINSSDIQQIIDLPDSSFKDWLLTYVWKNQNITKKQLETIYKQSAGENLSILRNVNYPISSLMDIFFYLIDEKEVGEAFDLLKYIVKNNNITENELQELVDFVIERYGDKVTLNFEKGNALIHLTLCKYFNQKMADQMNINKQKILERANDLYIYDDWEDKGGVKFLKNNPQINNLK